MFLWHRHDWVPLNQQLNLTPGVQRTREFTTDQSIDYYIQIEADPLPNRQTVECELGVPLIRDSCNGVEPVVDVRWTLSKGGQQVLAGHSAPNDSAGYGSSIFRNVGTFRGSPGNRYTLAMDFVRNASSLSSAKPRVQISGDIAEWEVTVLEVWGLLICAFAYGVFNALWVVVILIRHSRRGRSPS
jgi:hypothetical protein